MPVKVYIWRISKTGNLGHVSMSLSNGTHISWWPVKEVGHKEGGKCKNFSAPARKDQTLKDDYEFEGTMPIEYTIPMSPENEEKIDIWWTIFRGSVKDYHLVDMNCCTVVYKALSVVYPFLKWFKVIPVWIPAAMEWIAKLLSTKTQIDPEEAQEFNAKVFPEAELYLKNLQ